MTIAERIKSIRKTIPGEVTVIAVSKTKPVNQMLEAYLAGIRDFGENKAQELLTKVPLMPDDTIWHFIGHLQSNKVKMVAPFVHLVHSLDSFGLLQEIQKEARKNNRVIRCLLQFHIATEETKFGLNEEEGIKLVRDYLAGNFDHVRITGVMGMASYSENEALIMSEFSELHHIFQTLKSAYFASDPAFNIISMGMSGDYSLALAAGSTMVRIGSSIFGDR